jgi:hypothetical protein
MSFGFLAGELSTKWGNRVIGAEVVSTRMLASQPCMGSTEKNNASNAVWVRRARFNNSSNARTSKIKRCYVKVGLARRIMDQQIGLVAGPMYPKSKLAKTRKCIESETLLKPLVAARFRRANEKRATIILGTGPLLEKT